MPYSRWSMAECHSPRSLARIRSLWAYIRAEVSENRLLLMLRYRGARGVRVKPFWTDHDAPSCARRRPFLQDHRPEQPWSQNTLTSCLIVHSFHIVKRIFRGFGTQGPKGPTVGAGSYVLPRSLESISTHPKCPFLTVQSVEWSAPF